MDFIDEYNNQFTKIIEEHDVYMQSLKRVCQEIGFQTQYTYSEAIYLVSSDLQNGSDINKIILKYGLDKESI